MSLVQARARSGDQLYNPHADGWLSDVRDRVQCGNTRKPPVWCRRGCYHVHKGGNAGYGEKDLILLVSR